jgi:extracellular matrix protein 14
MKPKATSLVASLLLVQATHAAGIAPQRSLYGDRLPDFSTAPNGGGRSDNGRLFPLLTKFRDGVVELLFGRHPTKDVTRHPSTPDSFRARYANELVLRFNVSTPEEETALSEAISRLFLDVWAFTNDFVDVRLHANDVAPLLGLLPQSLQTAQSTLIPDLAAAVYQSLPDRQSQTHITAEGLFADLSISSSAGDNLFFQDYQPLPVIIRWMRLLEAMFPTYVEYISIGQSYEGRDIPALRVGVSAPATPTSPRKTIVVTGGLHGREWISTSTVNYVAWSFITSFGKEPMITKLLDEFDVVFIPAVNPDGFEYTWQVDRLWRKSRQQTNLRYCRGLDLDHAFGYEWDSAEMLNDPCSESYGGEQPFQAIEAIRLAEWARNQTLNYVKFVGLLDLHSYSQQVLFPFSYSCAVDPPNLEKLEELAAGIAKSIRLSNGESYSVTSACNGAVAANGIERQDTRVRIESGGGSAIDWFYHEMRAHFSYQIKLRDTGSYGFLLPKEHIVPTGVEVFDAMKYFGDYLLGNNGIETTKGEDLVDESRKAPQANDGDITAEFELRRRRMRR